MSDSVPVAQEAVGPRVVNPPSMQRGDINDPKLAAALKTLELAVRHKLDGVLHGDYLGLLPGPGSEPGESLIYQPATTYGGWTGRLPPVPPHRTYGR